MTARTGGTSGGSGLSQWATDLTLSDDAHRRELGYSELEVLARRRLAGPEELDLLDVALTAEFGRRPELLDDGWVTGDDGCQTSDDQSEEAP